MNETSSPLGNTSAGTLPPVRHCARLALASVLLLAGSALAQSPQTVLGSMEPTSDFIVSSPPGWQTIVLQDRSQSVSQLEAELVQSGLKVWATAPGMEQPIPERSGPAGGRVMGFSKERPALDEVITLQTAAGPVRVPYGYLSTRPSREALATGHYSFGFAFWMPGGRMPTGDTSVLSLLPDEPASRDPLRREHLVSLGPMIAPGVTQPGGIDLGSSSNQRLYNIFSIIGRDNFTYEVGPRVTRAVPKAGTSAFDLYYSTPDGAGGPLPFNVRCPTQDRVANNPICDGRVLFPSLGLFSELRIRHEAVHLLPEALDVAARLLTSWMNKK